MAYTYHIDKLLSEQNKCLVVEIKDENFQSIKSIHNVDSRDQIVLEWLKKNKKVSETFSAKTSNPTLFHITYANSLQALKLIAGTGKLFFNQKNLVCDFYSKTKLVLEFDDAIAALLEFNNQRIHLQECDFLSGGSPNWFIKGIFLRCIESDISWKLLKKLFLKEASLEDLEEDELTVVYNTAKPTKEEPFPFLMLSDRSGAFANLYMRYGEKKYQFHEQGEIDFKRNFEQEKAWEKDLLETGFIKKIVGKTNYFCPLDQVAKSLTFLLELGWAIYDYMGRVVCKAAQADLILKDSGTTLRICGKINFDQYQANVGDLVGSFNRRERFLQLSDHAVGLLPDSLNAIGLDYSDDDVELIGSDIQIKKFNIGMLENFSGELNEQAKNLFQGTQSLQNISFSPPGSAFLGNLRIYQQDGVNWLQFLYDNFLNGILADDMGLGKTVQVLAFISRNFTERPILVILPNSLIFNWKAEINRFLNHVSAYVHHGGQRIIDLKKIEESQIILTTYSTLRADVDLLSSIPYEMVILDEAQAIKNPETQIAQALLKLQARFKLSISGTPIENNLRELWSQFRFLLPGLFKDLKSFETEISSMDSRYLDRIKKKIRPFILRRKKEQVAKDLPEKIEQIVWVEMEASHRRHYEEFLKNAKKNLIPKISNEGIGKYKIEVLETILRLRQICCHPLLVTSLLEENNDLVSSKLDVLLNDIETIILEGKKALVYSQFTSMLKLIGKELKKKNVSYAYLDGTTTNREEVVEQFQKEASTPLFLISLKAGGMGLNLTAADYVFLFDPWWNNAVENQAIDRAHRIGRNETVIAKRYLCVDSIEEKILKLKTYKQNLASGLLEGMEDLQDISIDDLSFLLEE